MHTCLLTYSNSLVSDVFLASMSEGFWENYWLDCLLWNLRGIFSYIYISTCNFKRLTLSCSNEIFNVVKNCPTWQNIIKVKLHQHPESISFSMCWTETWLIHNNVASRDLLKQFSKFVQTKKIMTYMLNVYICVLLGIGWSELS